MKIEFFGGSSFLKSILHTFFENSPKQLPFGNQFVAKCPCHDDEHPSLYIKEDEETGNILLYCMAGCKTEDIVKALIKHISYYKIFGMFGFLALNRYEERREDLISPDFNKGKLAFRRMKMKIIL